MQANDGREPTDAELLRDLWEQWMDGDANEYRDAMRGARVRGREYLSGTRPMPKSWPITLEDVLQHEGPRPAPTADEAEQLVTCTKCDWIGEDEDLVRCDCPEDGEACDACPNCETDEHLLDIDPYAVSDIATRLTARVAELEAERNDWMRLACAVQPSDDHESLYCHDTEVRGKVMGWMEGRSLLLTHTAPGGEGGGK